MAVDTVEEKKTVADEGGELYNCRVYQGRGSLRSGVLVQEVGMRDSTDLDQGQQCSGKDGA